MPYSAGLFVCTLAVFGAALMASAQSNESAGSGAEDSSKRDSQSAAPTYFSASINTTGAIGFEPVRQVQFNSGTNEFAFYVPRGIKYRVDTFSSDKITITAPDCSYFVTVRLTGGHLQTGSEGDPNAALRERILSEYAGAFGFEESSASADGQSGPAFEANWYLSENMKRVIRVAFIPTRAGVLECSLVADPKKASEARSALNSVLLTLRSNKNGKLEQLVLSDKT